MKFEPAIAYCAFATKINALEDPGNPFVLNALDGFNVKPIKILAAFILLKFINNWLGVKTIFGQDEIFDKYEQENHTR